MGKWYLYILRCNDNSLYIGISSDLKERIERHNRGNAALYTKNKRPVELVYYELFANYQKALKREQQIKKWRREKKENPVKFGKPFVK